MTEHDSIIFSAVLLGGIVLIAGVITLLDWLARRKDRQARNRAA